MKKTQIFSIFGQIEGVVADMMASEGLVTRIDARDVPATARFDDAGRICHCAVVLTPEMERQFNRRVADLRA